MTHPEQQLTPEQLARIQAFKATHGTYWRSTLSDMWMCGDDANQPDGHLLRQVRNQFGPRWLATTTVV